MRWEVDANAIPTMIIICDDASMQLMWGTTNTPATYMAGPAHGELKNCENHAINSRISKISLNKVNGDAQLLYSGVKIETFSGQTIEWGNMDTSAVPAFSNPMPEVQSWTNGGANQFFGFATEVDTVENAPVKISFISYETATFATDRAVYAANPALIAVQQALIDTADDGLQEW